MRIKSWKKIKADFQIHFPFYSNFFSVIIAEHRIMRRKNVRDARDVRMWDDGMNTEVSSKRLYLQSKFCTKIQFEMYCN